MPSVAPDQVTRLLAQARQGDEAALGQLVPLVYEQLRALAHGQRFRFGGAETINTTALVHEAYEKLARGDGTWQDREHFFRIAARAMRDVLVDYARAQRAEKRGGGQSPLPLDLFGGDVPELQVDEVIGLDDALRRLEQFDPELTRLVELRYFTGLSNPGAAEVLGVSDRTVKRRWAVARAWLYREMTE